MSWSELPRSVQELCAIGGILAAVAIVIWRLPRVEMGHSPAFRRRRLMNWLPLGLTYAFLYMGRYNLNEAKNALATVGVMSNEDFGAIFFWGSLVYGVSFVFNGPLTDRFGGRRTILIGALGSAVMNALMGWALLSGRTEDLRRTFSLLYAGNMYFQSFGAVAIVKVNARWFHVRERGVFGGIFGILISLGIYFAFDWSKLILDLVGPAGDAVATSAADLRAWWVFFVPAAILAAFCVLDTFLVFDAPSQVGHRDFELGDQDLTAEGERISVIEVFSRMLRNPVILTIALIEFCSGYVRQAVMQWGRIFGAQTGLGKTLVFDHWGMFTCVAGILGGVFAGTISDHVFHSRRGPVTSVLYGLLLIGALAMIPTLGSPGIGIVMVCMSLCVIGVHGMLSGTASMDFGGKRNAGVAVGIIDGFVYVGTAAQAGLLGRLLPDGDAAKDAGNWTSWPLAIAPVALIGLVLATRVWNARPKPRSESA